MKNLELKNIPALIDLKSHEMHKITGGGPIVEMVAWVIGYFISTMDTDTAGQQESWCGNTSRTCAMIP